MIETASEKFIQVYAKDEVVFRGNSPGKDTQLVVLDEPKCLYLLRHQPEFALVVMQKLCKDGESPFWRDGAPSYKA